MSGLLSRVVGDVGDTVRWRRSRSRVQHLPGGYRAGAQAIERYLLHAGVVRDGGELVDMHERVVGAFVAGAEAGTSLSAVVGGDPVRFANRLLGSHLGVGWGDGELRRLVRAFAAAERLERGRS